MAKQRLVDFRGGLNDLISPHMIGDSQGQDALNVDLSAVRLQGRLEIDPSSTADGSFFYEYGNVSATSFDGRWVSIYPEDTNTYLAGATDFAVWNKDLYVAYGEGSTDGKLRVYRDSADVAEVLDFNPPSSLSIATYNATVTSEFLAPTETLINSVAGINYVPPQTGIYPVTSAAGTGEALISAFNPPYTFAGYNSGHSRNTYSNGTTYYEDPSTKRLQQNTGGSAGYTVTLSINTVSQFVPIYQYAGTFNDYSNRPYSGIANFTFNLYTRNGTTYYYAPSSNSTLGVSGGSFYTKSSTGSSSTTDTWTAEQMQLANSDGTVTMYGNYVAYTTIVFHENYAQNTKFATVWVNPPGGTYGDFNTVYSDSVNYSSQSAMESAYSSSGNRSTFTGTDGNVYRRAGAYRAIATNQYFTLYYYGLQQRTGTTTTYTNNTYSVHNNSQSFPATYTYQDITDTVPAVTGKPETPAFTYDKARSKIYLEYTSDSDVNSEDTDNAQGAQWLLNRDFSLTDNGYYLKTVRESNNLPQVSSSGLKATLASNNSYVLGASLEHTPQRLNFTIGTPTDNATAGTTLKGYKLERRDSISTVDLGYISPDTGVSFDYTPSTKAVTITLPTSTTAKYRLKFSGYQNTHVQLNSLTAVKSNMSGFTFTGSSNKPTITLIPQDGASQQFLAADFWLERVIIDGATSADDIYATVRCFDVFDRNGNAVSSGTIEGTSDFLDVFPNGLSSGAISDSGAEEGVPTYLKFLRESNNFFFAVGTESTPNNRYASTNKADSYLFISEYNNPRSWPLSGYLEFDSSITGLASYPGELIAFTEGGVYRVTGSRYDQMRKTKLATTEGLPNNQDRSIALVNRYLCWVSQTGICIYNGESVTNITRGRLENFNLTGSSVHAGQFEDVYYVVDSSETGYSVDFSLEGFPVSRIDLTEGDTTTPSNSASPPETLPPVLVYRPSVNRLYSRRGVIEGVSTRNLWNYKTRAFDGGAFGSIKLVRNVTVNGTGSGKIQIYLDGKPVFKNSSNVATPKTISITDSTTSTRTEPARVYVPATSDTIYGLSVADVWSVEITDWNGRIDWIDTEYEILSGG